ncbi:Toluene efflux pump periplasmic linker protein ttgA [Fibrisoma limi BUZ 3]|uniref:Toluene efflux pump periplasmic linker protein ttgA n=1 Tax=Fibrisoma limi BUZ 3 TaxID=1185876 RepID=I2GIX8_9BACT|nr:efflux RND transporter periplasmic adaptor subunit [Fibrisoma limi]CCH53853.1 Toluene efflux pump periplasmic linker protein ttgA [Fibrisoma limi BUZ 3]
MKKWIAVLIGLLVAGGAIALLMSSRRKQEAQLQLARQPLATTVAVARVQQRTFTEPVEYIGKTEAWREVQMTATTQGVIRELYAHLNGPVRQDQPIARVDAELTEIALQAAEAAWRKAQVDLVRYETLHRENNVPAVDLENARLQARNAESQLLTLKKQLRDAIVKSPIGGTVTEKNVEKGMFISPGTPLMTITDVSAVKLVVTVPEADLAQFWPGRRVPVTFEAYPNQSFNGTVHQIRLKGGEVGRFPVEIRVANGAQRHPLRVGMTAHVTVTAAQPTTALSIPRTALIPQSRQPAVYLFRNGRIAQRPVKTERTVGEYVLVGEGLQPGDSVVVSGTSELRNGQFVQVARNDFGQSEINQNKTGLTQPKSL